MRMRSLLGTAATAVLMVAGLATSATAVGATPAPGASGSGTTIVLPAPPADAGTRVAAAASPSVSPSAPSTHQSSGASFTCASGNFCAMVWDYSTGSWEVFRFDRCATYALSNWEDGGFYGNNQTGGRATATFYGQGGRWLKDVPISAPPAGAASQDWSPVWSIRNCY